MTRKRTESHRHAVPLLRRKSAQKCPKVSPKSAKILEPSCFRQNMLTNIAPGVFQPLHSWILVCPQNVPKSVKTMSESRSLKVNDGIWHQEDLQRSDAEGEPYEHCAVHLREPLGHLTILWQTARVGFL